MSGNVVNPFVGARVAARYARARPPLHGRAVALMREQLAPPKLALDLACGTGLSTRPLASFAARVVGVDVSEDMLAWAHGEGPISLVAAQIERLPFSDSSFDFASIASAIHWIPPEALREIRRVLVAGAPLVVYDVWFPGEIVGVSAFSSWLDATCGPRYPSVPKREMNVELLQGAGFDSVWKSQLREPFRMTRLELVDYLMTHSERISAVRTGHETEEQQSAFFREHLQQFFSGARDREVMFGIELEIYRKVHSA